MKTDLIVIVCYNTNYSTGGDVTFRTDCTYWKVAD